MRGFSLSGCLRASPRGEANEEANEEAKPPNFHFYLFFHKNSSPMVRANEKPKCLCSLCGGITTFPNLRRQIENGGKLGN